MLQRDYLLEILIRFIETLTRALKRAVEQNDLSGCREAERAVADLLELDPETAMVLAPASLVQMMELSSVGSAVASYVGYTLDRVADIYEDGGDEATAELRRALENVRLEIRRLHSGVSAHLVHTAHRHIVHRHIRLFCAAGRAEGNAHRYLCIAVGAKLDALDSVKICVEQIDRNWKQNFQSKRNWEFWKKDVLIFVHFCYFLQ